MKAVVFRDIADIRLEDVPNPKIQDPTDAIVRITDSAICGTDLHFIRGTVSGVEPGTILGHEGVGVVEEVGKEVRNLRPGDRVVIPSTIACGSCSYCRAGYFSQCDQANPGGKQAGTAFFGGPKANGGFHGLQAERARIPFAHVGLVKLPDEVSDAQALMMSDIFPTGYFGADIAEIREGDTVVVFGCGPVGQFAIMSAFLMGAGRVFAVDGITSRLDTARKQGAETINFNEEDPVEVIKNLTNEIGADRAIDAVGVDAQCPHHGPAAQALGDKASELKKEQEDIAPDAQPDGEHWVPGDAPSLVLRWAVEALAKAGTLSIIGVYPPNAEHFPIGAAMNKNLTMNMGNCPHRRYIPKLVRMTRRGEVDPAKILSVDASVPSAIEAYQKFDLREAGWLKVRLLVD